MALGIIALIATGVIWTKTIKGTADIPSGAHSVLIPVSASLPYTIRKLTPDWEAAGVFVEFKESGRFKVFFNRDAPNGGGALDWEILPRGGDRPIAPTSSQLTETPAPTPTPEPILEQFVHGEAPHQKAIHFVHAVRRPGNHIVNIVSTETSHDIAFSMVNIIDGMNDGWTVMEHGTPGSGTFIGTPTDYALDDGFTIRARADSIDAETIRGALTGSGLEVKRVLLPDNDPRTYVLLEIGNVPGRLRK